MTFAGSVTIPARPHDFALVPVSTALLIIDMQNDFCHPDGFCCGNLGLDPEPVRRIIPRIAQVREWSRARGIAVFYTRESHPPDLSDLSESKRLRYETAGYPVGAPGKLGRFLIQGERGCALLDELTPNPGEMEFDKPAQSAFIGTDLEARLRERGIRHLLITGVTTQCCVLATYRSANDLGFFSLLLEDCCGAFEPEAHQAAVEVVQSENGAVGWVATSLELIAAGKLVD